jgi:hypothetical protein
MFKYCKILLPILLFALTATAQTPVSTTVLTATNISALQSYKGGLTVAHVTDTARGGWFVLTPKGTTILDSGVNIYSSNTAYFWRRDIDQSASINPLWWGITASDTTFDNAPAINSAIAYAALVGAKISLNSNRNYTIKTPIQGVRNATFELGYADTLTCGADGISVINVVQGFKCTLNGLIFLKNRVSTAVTMDGRSSFGTQNFNNIDYVFNVKGAAPLVLGQVAVRMQDIGNDTANSTRTSYIKFIHIKAIAIDTILTVRATRKGNTNNCWFDFMSFNTINGIYIETDSARGSIFAGNRMTGNITASDYTQSLLVMNGTSVRENIIDLKFEDVERHEVSKKDLPIRIGAGTTGNWFRFRGIETDNVYDAGWMNIFDMKDVGNDPAITQNSTLGTLPSGGFDRPQGDLSDILLGIDQKPGYITVSTTSTSTSGNVSKMFDLDADAVTGSGLPTSFNISDAVASDQTILLGFESPIRNPKDFIVSFAPGMGVKRCKVEGYSVDSLKWYTIRDYDTLTGINRELIYNLSQVIPTAVLKCTNLPNSPDTVCRWGYNRIPFKNLDSIRITIRANDVAPVSGIVQIRKLALTAYGADANSYAKTTGGTLYGTWDFTNATINGFSFSDGVTQGHLNDFNMFSGANQGAYNVDNTTAGDRPAGFTIGEMWFSHSKNAGSWDSILPASQLLSGTNGANQSMLYLRSFAAGTWSDWTSVSAGGTTGTDTLYINKQLKIPVKDTTAYTGHKQGRITFSPTLLTYFGDNGTAWISLSGGGGGGGSDLESTLTAGSALSTSHTITGSSNDLSFTGFANLNMTSNNRSLNQSINTNTLSSLDSTYILAGSALTMAGVNVFSNGTTSNTWGTTGKTFVSDATGIKLNGDSYTVSNSTMPLMKDTLTGYLSHSHVDLTRQVKGILPVANGGTGAATLTANGVLIGNGTSAISSVAPGASGNVLQSDGTNWISGASGAATSTTSAATSLTMSNSITDYVFTGTAAATWTLPALSSTYKLIYFVKNRGTAQLTVKRAGSDQVYTYRADSILLLNPGEQFRLQNDSTYWNTNVDIWTRGNYSGTSKNIVYMNLIKKSINDTIVIGDAGYPLSGGINLATAGGIYIPQGGKWVGINLAPDNITGIQMAGMKKGLYIQATSAASASYNIDALLTPTGTTNVAGQFYGGIQSRFTFGGTLSANKVNNFMAQISLATSSSIFPIPQIVGYDFLIGSAGGTNNTVDNIIQYSANPAATILANASLVSTNGKIQGFFFDSLAATYHQYNTGITTYGFRQLRNTLFDSTVNAFGSNTSIGTNAIPTAKLMLGAGTATTAPEKGTTGTLLSSITAYTKELSTNFYATNSALNRYAEGGKIYGDYTDASNTGTAETDLYTYTTKANTLLNNGEELRYEVAGNFSDLTATCELKFYFGGVNIGSTGALTVSATGSWKANVIIIKSGSTTARSILTLSAPGTSTPNFTIETDLTGLTLTGTNIIKVTGTATGASGGSNDITAKLASLHWYGAANN